MGAKHFGARVARLEDPTLLTGRGRFVDDIRLAGALHACFVRSPHPHAAIRSVDASAARAMPGVHAVLTADDLPPRMASGQIPMLVPNPSIKTPRTQLALARREVCYVGQTVAVAIADNRYLAEDAAAAVNIEFELLPAVSDCRDAARPGQVLGAQRPAVEFRDQARDIEPQAKVRHRRAGVPVRHHGAEERVGQRLGQRRGKCVVDLRAEMARLRARGLVRELRVDTAHTEPEPPDSSELVSPAPAEPTISRRGALSFAGAGSLLLLVVSAVMMITAASLWSARSRSNRLRPSKSGRRMSRRIRSGSSRIASRSPCSPRSA
jgi:CO/xanthine dehydrogenase Mo-binding subunit